MDANKLLIRNRLGGTYEKHEVRLCLHGTTRVYTYKRKVSSEYLDGSISTSKARQGYTTEIRTVTDPKELSEINASFEQGKRELEATWGDNLAELEASYEDDLAALEAAFD
jgi:hypothetical protein